jgi:hypothetical protein
MASRGRAPVARAQRRCVKVWRLRPAQVPPLNRATPLSDRNNGNTRDSNSDLEVASDLRSMRIERRDLLNRLSDADSRANTEEKAMHDILADTSAIYDEGTELWL